MRVVLLVLLAALPLTATDPDGTTALHWAVRQNDLQQEDKLIHEGADVKAANRYGVTPLSLACLNGDAVMIELLLKAGADSREPGPEGETPLMTVARVGSVDAAKTLIDHGAEVNAKESWRGQTALMWAVAERHAAMA